MSFARVSVHGGHSGSFCGHAIDPLEDVVKRYIELDFAWVCLTEHMPSEQKSLMPPEDEEAGFDPAGLMERFDRYFAEARRLQATYAAEIEIFVGFETEGHSDYEPQVAKLIARYEPDMIVGSVHHMYDHLYDGFAVDYGRAVALAGSIERLYCDYFDRQLELIERFRPAIVGHFDLIRIHDPHYMQRWDVSEVRDKALRNLERIKELGLILDLNTRALAKGASEPYVSDPLMRFAIDEGIPMTPGDDSHGVDSVGMNLERGVEIFVARGGSTEWVKPSIGSHTP